MTWKRYQNELIALMAFVFMLGAYGYKTAQVSSQAQSLAEARHSLEEVQEVISLKKIWDDTRTGKKVERLQTLVPSSKFTWNCQNKKVTAS